MTNFTIGNLSDPKERQAIEELQTLIPMISNQKTTKNAIAKKEILRLLSDGKFYSTRGLAAKIPYSIANQRMVLRYLKELEMAKKVYRTSFLWSIN
jgi:hypothetical protein